MHSDFHDIFALESGAMPLRYQGALDQGRWTEGTLTNPDASRSFAVTHGIPHIAGIDRDPWGDDARVRAHFGKLGQTPAAVVESQHEAAMSDPNRYRPFAGELRDITETGGRILEVACGHGGGFSPYILKVNPDASLLMTDLGRWLLTEWRSFAERKGWPKLSFAQADPAQLPFANESFKAVISLGGYTNLMPDSVLFKEAYRVLEPGGRFFILDARPDPAAFRKFPTEVREHLRAKYPTFGIGYMEFVRKMGFSKGEFLETGRHPMTTKGGPVGSLAKQHKVRLEICFCKVLAYK